MSTHTRLARNMRSPVRQARRKKSRQARQERRMAERAAAGLITGLSGYGIVPDLREVRVTKPAAPKYSEGDCRRNTEWHPTLKLRRRRRRTLDDLRRGLGLAAQASKYEVKPK